MSRRDERLGFQLRELDVPDHHPGFYARLAERIDLESVDSHRRRGRPGWASPPMLLGLVAAVLLAVVGMSSVLTDRGSRLAPAPEPEPTIRLISATEVRSRVTGALSSLQSLSGEVTLECAVDRGACTPPPGGGRTTQRWTFVTTAAGDERITGIDRLVDLSYSASRRELRVVLDSVRTSVRVRTGMASGPPDFNDRSSVLRRDVASVVRAFLATTDDVPVTDVVEQDRAAWRLVTAVVPNKLAGPGRSADQMEVIVDQETGFPLRVTETLAGRFLTEVRLSKLVVNGPVDTTSFVLELPAGVQPFNQDDGFRRVELGEVAAVVGYRPLLPTPASLPPGFVLAEVTVAANGPVGSATRA